MPSQCVKSAAANTKSVSNSSTTTSTQQPSTAPSKNNQKIEPNTITGNPSSSLKTEPVQPTKYGLSLLGNPAGNSNQIYLTLDTSIPIDFPDQATMLNFLKVKF